MRSLRVLALALPFALAASGSAQTILLRFKPAIGTKVTYTMSTSMLQSVPGMPAPMSTSTVVPLTMRAVTRSGNQTTMETKMGQAKITMPPGSPMAGMKPMLEKSMSGMASTSIIDELGSVQSNGSAGQGAGMMGNMNQNGQTIAFPKKAVKVGDTWNETLDLGKMLSAAGKSGMTVTGKIPITYKLVALKKVGGRTLATISMTMKGKSRMTMPQGTMDMTMTSKGQTVVDTVTGMFVSSNTTSDTAMNLMGKDMHQHMVMSMTSK